MSWSNEDWQRRDEQVRETYGRDPERSIYFPPKDDDLLSAMKEYLESRSLSFERARLHGWYPAWSRGPRVIIPCVRTDGKNFWQGRLLENVLLPAEDSRSYIFAVLGPEGNKRWESPRGPRGDALCFLDAPRASTLVIVEGPMDALAASMTGASAVATLGVGAPGAVLAHIGVLAQQKLCYLKGQEVGYDKVIIVPDRDEIGQWVKIQAALGTMGVPTQIREPAAKDLCDLSPHKREELLSW